MYFFNLFVLLNTIANLYLLKNSKRKTGGKDQRYEENTDLDPELLSKITHNELKKQILETLLDNNVNDINKIFLIKSLDLKICDCDSSIQTFNLNSGNLLQDFHFQFDGDDES